MPFVSVRNVVCAFGLFAGATLIAGADIARAETRPCTQDEMSRIEFPQDLPPLCEVMTVTAERRTSDDVAKHALPRAVLTVELRQNVAELLRDHATVRFQTTS